MVCITLKKASQFTNSTVISTTPILQMILEYVLVGVLKLFNRLRQTPQDPKVSLLPQNHLHLSKRHPKLLGAKVKEGVEAEDKALGLHLARSRETIVLCYRLRTQIKQ